MTTRETETHLTMVKYPNVLGFAIIVDPKNKFTFSEIYVSIYDYGIFNRFT